MDALNERFLQAVLFVKRNGYARSNLEMSERMGVKPSAISMAVRGSRLPSLELMARLCDAYPVDYWWLLRGEGGMVRGEREHALLKRIGELEAEILELKRRL